MLVFAGIIGAVLTICYEDPQKGSTMTAEHFSKVAEAIQNGKSDEEIMETLYVDKRDINIVKSILEREKNKERNHGD